MVSWRVPAAVTLLGGMVLVLALAPLLVLPLREQLHVNCGYATMGEATGSWMCQDGISYIFPGLGLVFGAGVALPVALLLIPASAGFVRAAARLLSPAPMLLLGVGTAANTLRTDDLPSGLTWPGLWWDTVGFAAALASVGVAVLAIASGASGGAERVSGGWSWWRRAARSWSSPSWRSPDC